MLGFEPGSAREGAYLISFLLARVYCSPLMGRPKDTTPLLQEGGFTDVFIVGNREDAVATYATIETHLARSAAVNFVDGDANVPIR